jgi:hypothetical protein
MLSLSGFGANLDAWRDCELNIDVSNCQNGVIAAGNCTFDRGQNCDSLDPRNNVPAWSLMALYYIVPDFIIILFGIMFGFVFLRKFLKECFRYIKYQITHPCSRFIPVDSDDVLSPLRTHEGDQHNQDSGKTKGYSDAKTIDSRASLGLRNQASGKASLIKSDSVPLLHSINENSGTPKSRPTGGSGITSSPHLKPIKLEKQISIDIPKAGELHSGRPISLAQRQAGDDILAMLERDASELSELQGII